MRKLILKPFYTLALLLGCLTFVHSLDAFGQRSCSLVYRRTENKGAAFLHQKNPNLHTSPAVEWTTQKLQKSSGPALQKPADKVAAWIQYLEQASARYADRPEILLRIKDSYHQVYLTKLSEVPESFFALHERKAREQGRMNEASLTEAEKRHLAETTLEDQKKSLDIWLDYFLSADSKFYPMWSKYWAFTSVVKLARFNPETGTFSHRSRGQMSPFPELNREAFAMVIDAVVRKVNGHSLQDIQDPRFLDLLKDLSFEKLYGRALQLVQSSAHQFSLQGHWVIFKQGSDPRPLVQSLAGMNTGWCTAGLSTAQEQLSKGDFHIFYSKDESGTAKVPRIAIRFEGPRILEVRGVADQQNLDSQIASSSVLAEKLKEFGSEGDRYQKRSENMKRLTGIEAKQNSGLALSRDELRFLYELDAPIEGFGSNKDPRIEEIISKRNARKDLADLLGAKESEISLTNEEAIQGGIKYHRGDLRLNQLPASGHFPEIVTGEFQYSGDEPLDGWTLPRKIGRDLWLKDVPSAQGTVFPESVGGGVYLQSLESARGLRFPRSIGGLLWISYIRDAEGAIWPEDLKGSVILPRGFDVRVLPEGLRGKVR